MKLHLTARAPNEGARLLARWVVDRHAGDVARAGQQLTINSILLQRIVAGEFVPGSIVGIILQRELGIRSRDFGRAARGGWFDADDAASSARAA